LRRLILITIGRIIFYQCICIHCFAQETATPFHLVEGNNNEPLGGINAITQDENGYMWFSGTGKRCLYKYDGVRMTAYPLENMNPASPIGNFPETVYADRSGMIWVGFVEEGLDLFDPLTTTFRHYRHDPAKPNSLSGGMVSVILRDHLGRLWIGTASGMDLMDEKTGTFMHYRNEAGNPSSLSSSVIRTIYEDRKGVLWVGTGFEFRGRFLQYISDDDGGLNRMDSLGKFKRYLHDPSDPSSLINNKVKSLFEDSRGIFWVGTSEDGLHTMDRATGKFTRHTYDPNKPEGLARPPLKEEHIGDPITFIREDAAGGIWIATYLSGMNRYDTATKKITHYESSNGYPDKNCWAGYESRDGVLWLSSTDPVGFLYRWVPEKNNIRDIPTLNFISCIAEDNQGSIWGAGFQTGLLQFDKNKKLLRTIRIDPTDSVDLGKFQVGSILQGSGDTLWLSTQAGVVLMNTKTFQLRWLRYRSKGDSLLKKFNDMGVFQIVADKNGVKWIWTKKGLYEYSGEHQTLNQYHIDIEGEYEPNTPLLLERDGDLWAATTDGIAIFNAKTGATGHLMKGIKVNCLYQDAEGSIWAGTNNRGLFRYNRSADSMVVFLEPQSVSGGDKIVNVIEDVDKKLWIVTGSAIMKCNADRKQFFVYGKKNGIRSNTLRHGGIWKTMGGEILIGNAKGFYVLSPREMNEVSHPLQLNITGFTINNKPVVAGMESSLPGAIEETNHISLPYQKNNFSFSFAAIDYRAPEANKYYTLLENFDSVWRDAGGDKTANYINIPPGHYIFRVKATNIDNITTEKAIDIIISPPWYKTWWAYTIYCVITLTFIVVIHRFQQQRTIRREREMAQVKELAQAREIEQAYAELKSTQAQLIQSEKMASLGEMTAGIAHEMRNPLNFVNNFTELNNELIGEIRKETEKGISENGRSELIEELLQGVYANNEKINFHGKRADAIVKSMLQHSQGGTGTKEPTDINDLADKYLRLAYSVTWAKDNVATAIGLKTDFDGSLKDISIIPQDIGKALLNLYNNAFYAVREKAAGKTPEDWEPQLIVTTKKYGNQVIISVMDNGSGIPENIIDKIFQPFFTTKPTGQGTGLGLSLAYDIVKAHGGLLSVESKPGEGSIFTIRLPMS
jgi:signal transduction histidine kinase/ligand-binding sensor domain-containing protein